VGNLGISLEDTQIKFPRFLRREGDFNFRVLNDILDPANSEMTFKDFERCVNFNLPNHVVKVSTSRKKEVPTTSQIKNNEEESKILQASEMGVMNQSENPASVIPEEKTLSVKNDGKNESTMIEGIKNETEPTYVVQEEVFQEEETDIIVNKMDARQKFLEKNILIYGDAKPTNLMKNEILVSEEINIETHFIELFTKIEMGRQTIMDGRNRERIMRENKRKAMKTINKKMGHDDEMDSKKVEAAIQLQKFVRGFQARKQTKEYRRKKMKFLGLSIFNEHLPKDQNLETHKFMELVKSIEEKRKKGIQEKLNEMMEQRKIIKEELKENEGPEMMENMLQERREFILDFYEMHEGKQLPKNEKVFYERFDLKNIKTLEEDAKKMKKNKNKNKSKCFGG
jgi:hypothetical protein